MDKDLDTEVQVAGEYGLQDLTRDIAASLDSETNQEQEVEEKPKRGRPRKNPEEKKSKESEKEDPVPDVTETEEAEPSDEEEPIDEGDGTISIEDIPEDQRVEAASAIIQILTQEQKDSLLDQMGEGVADEIRKLRESNKALEQQIKETEQKSRSRIDKIISPNSFFADVSTESELDEKEKKIRANLDYFDNLIDSTDELFVINDKEYTREQVRSFRNTYRKYAADATEHRYRIRETAKYRERFDDNVGKLASKYDWYADEDSEERKKYNSLAQDIDLDHLRYVAPKSAALLPEIIAKYVSTNDKDEGARRIFRLPIKQAKPKNIRIASGGGIVQQQKDVVAETNRKAEVGELTMEDFQKAIAASL